MANMLKQFFVFMIGFFIGVILAVIYHDFNRSHRKTRVTNWIPAISDQILYDFSFQKTGLKRHELNPEDISFSDEQSDYTTEARFLYRNVSIICVVFVDRTTNTNAFAVTNTWGKKCNRLIFFGEKTNRYLNVKRVNSVHSWQYLCESIKHVWSKYPNELQWVLFAPDDIFVIPENLRFILAPKNFMKPYYIGHKVMFWNQIYNAASAGYVLSYAAVELLMNKFGKSCATSGKYTKNEDYYLGLHLEEVGVSATGALDDQGRQRFLLFTPGQLFAPGSLNVLQKYSQRSLSPIVQGFNCCSSTTISFQGTQKDLIYLYSYLLYNVKIFYSGTKGNVKSAVYTPMDQVWKNFIKEEVGNINTDLISNEDYYKLWTLKVLSPEEFNKKLKKLILSPL